MRKTLAVAGATVALIAGGLAAPSGASAQDPCPFPLTSCAEHIYDQWLTGPCAGPCWPTPDELCERLLFPECNLPKP